MEKHDLAKDVIEKLKEKELKPKPRWQFLASNYAIWAVGALALLMGGISLSVIIYLIKDNDWQVYEQIEDSLLGFIFLTLPYLWLIFMVVFFLVAHYNLKHTKKGYRLRLPFVMVAMTATSMLMGIVFYNAGIGSAIDRIFKEKSPLYYKLLSHRDMIWKRESAGFLGGKIVELSDDKRFNIIDIEGNLWRVDATRAVMPKSDIVLLEARVKMIGRRLDDNIFHAKFVAPFDFPMQMFKIPPPIPGSGMRGGMNMDDFERNLEIPAY